MRERLHRPLAERIPAWPSSQAILADLAEGPARAVEIAERTHYSTHTIGRALAALHRLGLVERAAGWRRRKRAA